MLDKNVAIGVRAAVADHLGRAPTRAELTAARRAAHSLAALGRARVLHVAGAHADDSAGDRSCERATDVSRCRHDHGGFMEPMQPSERLIPPCYMVNG